MNNYNQSLAEVATANQTIEQRIAQSQQQLPPSKLQETLSTGGQIVGGEFLRGGFETLSKTLAKKTGLKSIGNLGKNIKTKGFKAGVEQTIRDTQQEAVTRGKAFTSQQIAELRTRAQGVASQVGDAATGAVGEVRTAVQGAASQVGEASQGVASQVGDAAQGVASQVGDAATGAVSQVQSAAQSAAQSAGDAAPSFTDSKLYDAGQRTRLNLANKDLQNRGMELLNDEDRNLSPQEQRAKIIKKVQDNIRAKQPVQKVKTDPANLARKQSEDYQPNVQPDIDEPPKARRIKFSGIDYGANKRLVDTDKVKDLQTAKTQRENPGVTLDSEGSSEVNPFTGKDAKRKKPEYQEADKYEPVYDDDGKEIPEATEALESKRLKDMADDIDNRRIPEDPFAYRQTTLSRAAAKADAIAKKAPPPPPPPDAQSIDKVAEDLPGRNGVTFTGEAAVKVDNSTLKDQGVDAPSVSKKPVNPASAIDDDDPSPIKYNQRVDQIKAQIEGAAAAPAVSKPVPAVPKPKPAPVPEPDFDPKDLPPPVGNDLTDPNSSKEDFDTAKLAKEKSVRKQFKSLSPEDRVQTQKNIQSDSKFTNVNDLDNLKASNDTGYRQAVNDNFSIVDRELSTGGGAADVGGVDPTPPPVSSSPTGTSEPDSTPTQTSTPPTSSGAPPVEDDEKPRSFLNNPDVETGEAVAGIADPIIGVAEAGIGILGMLLPDLFSESKPPAAPILPTLSGTSTMGLAR